MRNADRAYLDKIIHGIQCDLDVLTMPENVEAMRGQLEQIASRIWRATQKEAA